MPIVAQSTETTDWVSRFADEVIEESERRAPGKRVVVASGLSPSGPIHLGNLREVMTPHLVADEIRRRGREVRHLISWDDYDRYRKVPAGVPGVDETWAEHIGKPLTSVPAPAGSAYPNWAEHFKAAMVAALGELGVEFDGISQTEQYTSGVYREQVLHAMRHRADIDAILDQYRTKKAPAKQSQKPLDEAELEAAEGSGAAGEDDGSTGSAGYFPYKPYCGNCEKDLTTVTAYDDDSTELTYTCTACAFSETVRLSEFNRGKLVWKVDWPMRWAYEGVVFEPSGVDHSSPGSSFQVGGQIVGIFGGQQPIGPMYAFVGISGMAKMSSSKGGVPTPGDALRIMEPQLLRWLYARRRPNQSFKIAFDQEIQRLYDEWDKLVLKVEDGSALPGDVAAYSRAVGTAAGELGGTARPLPYRTLASVADITAGHQDQALRILSELDPAHPLVALDDVRPRYDKAEAWINTHVPADQRTIVRAEADVDLLKSLDEAAQQSLRLLLDGLASNWSLDGLTHLVYGVPKVQAGFSADATPKELPAEIKTAQRTFFALLYHLLVGRDTGPRLPTLLLAVGQERVRVLLGE
ncbi:lysine--tRNA ligase [Streptomyces acidiscabies]|uniref:Lysine--tRNA ligase n=1 Tax=Streptomyces acidiscabies TaxID=42234 RepID=A0AAP6BK88_9ACTN|nr:lysine--tRNA ligase [Streptomyces acidiscabies]MBZ3914149.1 lysine--tRNA ligase [Streptomyces acidiscabies]MDX2966248.1 lysine--tRNA ligase [Streptomyces acidiscabies]MDX3025613.1 lysine--tRNA ligase [Streptomyces acidiscabies]MDX3796211.1 lysine--tRNA ligase [Streptomyces acidiscabies]